MVCFSQIRHARRIAAVGAALFAAHAAAASNAPDTTVVEYYNTFLKHYFLTATAEESAFLDAGGAGATWQRTGRGFAAWTVDGNAPATAVAVHRFYLPTSNTHFFTASSADAELLKSLNPTNADRSQWIFEGIAFRIEAPVAGVCAPGRKPIYRSYNNRHAEHDANHRIVGDAAVTSAMERRGWVAEGVAMCANATGVDPLRVAASSAEPAAVPPTVLCGVVGDDDGAAGFSVAGVRVDATNARYENGAVNARTAGTPVEVEGYPAANRLIATVVRLNADHPLGDPNDNRWQGYISSVAANGGIYVNGQLIDVGSAVIGGGSAASLRPGARVEVRGFIYAGVLRATRVDIETDGDDGDHPAINRVELRGTVSGYASPARFVVQGQWVDASAALVEHGTAADLRNGALIEVAGTVANGVLLAARLEFKSGAASGHDDDRGEHDSGNDRD